MKKIGFIGLGNMGSKMVINLLKANYEVVGYDINEKLIDQLIPNGVKKASSLKEILNDIDVIITMLPNGEIVEKIYESIINGCKSINNTINSAIHWRSINWVVNS